MGDAQPMGQSWPSRHAAEIAAAAPEARGALLRDMATDVRAAILRTIGQAGLGHVGGDLSVTDVLTTLLFGVMRLDPAQPRWPGRDRLILSKGHCAAALYSALALRGYFPPAELDRFMAPLSPLNGHPNRRKVPGVEANTGPLGHGLPIAVGAAHAMNAHKIDRVAILDFDVHHGNGTQDLLRDEARAMFVSSQQFPLWPGTGAADAPGGA